MRSCALFLVIVMLLACEFDKTDKVPQENLIVAIPQFNADSCLVFLEQQVGFGHRYMNTPEHEDCKNWLIETLQSFGFAVIPQAFQATAYNGQTLDGTNIIGRYNPQVKERMLLCAHYDTRHIADKDTTATDRPIDGADDGASGVAVILEIARQLKKNPIPMGVDVIFFDAEDYGSDQPGNDYSWGLGSQHWSKNLHEENYEIKYGILLDMVGAKQATFPKEGFSRQSAPQEVEKIWRLAQAMRHGNYFVNRTAGFYTDDHRFIVENTDIPMIDIINIKESGAFGSYHHTHADNLDIIDKRTLQAVGQVVLAALYKESNKENF
ncbi:MAG: DUF4910 domain-containing protein [Bacteroidota bacterium]